jgi:deoxyribodipyrimidine photolyase
LFPAWKISVLGLVVCTVKLLHNIAVISHPFQLFLRNETSDPLIGFKTMTEHALLESLDVSDSLKQRILIRVPVPYNNNNDDGGKVRLNATRSFILYLPTVILRKRHNPAFSVACHLANQHKVPVVVLCTVLDDQHLSTVPLSPTVMTARRLAFTLEALQSCCQEFEKHGAGVAIRLHGPGARTPHHLSLIHHAVAVISDEPFVDPHRNFLRRVVKACHAAQVPCFTVDGSTTVPPKSKLQISKEQKIENDIMFSGAPAKAWRWEQTTNPFRQSQVYAAIRDRAFDAPALHCKLGPNFFFLAWNNLTFDSCGDDGTPRHVKTVMAAMPSTWCDPNNPSPGQRPWTVEELVSISDCKEWAMTSWPGADTTVPPCQQTHGSSASAKQRWKSFVELGLKDYAKRRNMIVEPLAVSRISCYLNLGILSIFDVMHDIWHAKSSNSGFSTGCQKFLDEVVKFREGSYVHTFANPEYHSVMVLPAWSRYHLEGLSKPSSAVYFSRGFEYEQLESASTGDEVWDAMQQYLVDTGELHNNARMTW